MHPFDRPPFYPRVSSAGGAPSHLATSTPSYRTPNDSRAPQTRDTRIRAPRPDGPRRFAAVAPSNTTSSDISSVEQWRLSVLDGVIPPAPPGTPVSVASVKLATPTPASTCLGFDGGQQNSRRLEGPMSQATSTTWRSESPCPWGDGCAGVRKQEVFPLLVQRPAPAAKPIRHRNQYFKSECFCAWLQRS